MLLFICYFFPAVASVWLYEALSGKDLAVKQCVFRYCTNAVIINAVCFFAKRFVFFTGDIPMTDMTPNAALNYMAISVAVGVILVLVEVLLSKNVKVSVEEKSDETDKKEEK